MNKLRNNTKKYKSKKNKRTKKARKNNLYGGIITKKKSKKYI
jgi:hypothetical protein